MTDARTRTTTDHLVMVTGHRDLRGNSAAVAATLRHILERLRARQPAAVAISGMAIGADILFAEAALDLGLPLVAAVPTDDQASRWPRQAQERHRVALERARLVVEVWRQPGYEAASVVARFHTRNRWMIDHSHSTIAVWDGRRQGGTWETVRVALGRGRTIAVVDPATRQMRSERPTVPAHEDDRLRHALALAVAGRTG